MPSIKNNNWFFDTELIFYAYREGLRIKEFGITWKESERKSRVNIINTVFDDIKFMLSLKRPGKSRAIKG